MEYILFLDDERSPALTHDCALIVCRNFEQFQHVVRTMGFPKEIHFDHDLGAGPTGYDAIVWLRDHMLILSECPQIDIFVHSQNPIGKRNIMYVL